MYNFNKLLTNYDLIDICAKLNINLIDVVNKDMLINLEPQRGCYIINLQDARDGGGTHWVALILDDYVSYYDSFGLHLSEDVSQFISWYLHSANIDNDDCIYNSTQFQNMNSILCGYFCVYFLWFHTVMYSEIKDNKYLMGEHNSNFSKTNTKKNDIQIKRLFNNIINK